MISEDKRPLEGKTSPVISGKPAKGAAQLLHLTAVSQGYLQQTGQTEL